MVRAPLRKHLLLRDAKWGVAVVAERWRQTFEISVSQKWTKEVDCGLEPTFETFLDPWDAAEKRRLSGM